MPAAAVIPTLKVYVKVVAVKTLVVGFKSPHQSRKASANRYKDDVSD